MKKLDIRDYLDATTGVKGWFFPIDAALFCDPSRSRTQPADIPPRSRVPGIA